ncbi:MAG: DUF1540 domain-containing protein [Peptococcaceae bacterium]|nr:DUF1540 domain-containing protein [Candidatus Syntrophopropionicum ammoniitolerans]
MPQIFCSVNNCHYYGKGNLCQADKILITSDTMSQNLSANIDAPNAGQITPTPVAKCPETCCKTFVHKNDFNQNTDGVIKR